VLPYRSVAGGAGAGVMRMAYLHAASTPRSDSTATPAGDVAVRMPGGLPAAALAFAAGVAVLQQQAALPALTWLYALLAGAFATLLMVRSDGRFCRLAPWLWLPVLFGAGVMLAAFWADARLRVQLDPAWEGRDARVTGVIAQLPQTGERGVRFLFDVEHVATPSADLPARVSLTWYAEDGSAPALHPGQRWTLTVRLRRPHGTANPFGFDSEAWMLERGIRATGYVRQQPPSQLVDEMVHRPGLWIERARDAARDRILRALPGEPQAGVLAALAIGDQQAIAVEEWAVFTRTGVNHLMSISGLHITMLAALAFALVVRVWPRIPGAALRVAAQRAAAVAGLAVGLLYALLAGFEVPAQRTVLMLAVVALALAAGRPARSLDVLAVALIAVLALDPWAILAPGFWLSFGAVAMLLYIGATRIEGERMLGSWARVQWAITLGLVPVLVGMFQLVSLVSPLANAFAIPLVSLAVVPLTLAGTLLPVDLVLLLAAKLMQLCYVCLAWLNALPAAVWEQHAPPAWSLAAALAGVLWLLAPRGFPARWAGVFAFLPMFLAPAARPAPGEFWADVLDVGQGLAVVVRTHGHALLFDAGTAFSADFDSGSRIIVPHLRGTGVRELDAFVVSHDDIDHTGGVRAVLAALPVHRVFTSLPTTDARLQRAESIERCVRGRQWSWDGVAFTLLHPAADSYNRDGVKDNDRSCVLQVRAAAGSLLIAGDVERAAEAQLLAAAPAALRSDVLIAPHHGSRTSSGADFLAAVAPRIAVFTVGYRNRFGHPAPDVLDRYAALGARIQRSDADGAVLLRFGPQLAVHGWRAMRPRYWQDAASAAPAP
jgi:competence protein ComEC